MQTIQYYITYKTVAIYTYITSATEATERDLDESF